MHQLYMYLHGLVKTTVSMLNNMNNNKRILFPNKQYGETVRITIRESCFYYKYG